MNRILDKQGKFILIIDNADNHLSLMRNASNLLVHTGGFSALGAIVAKGNVFYTDSFSHVSMKNWKTHVDTKLTRIK